MPENTRVVFMGTPEFALPTFRALAERYRIVGVVTQPDRPAGRGRTLRPPPVKQAALTDNVPVFQSRTLRSPEALARLRDWAPDIIITAATGHILTPEVLATPARGTVNVHASLLPRWRGAAPIQAAILAGDAETGVTTMCTDEGLDTGPILSQRAIPIAPRETAQSLHDKLAELGADLLMETLPQWLSGELMAHPQPSEGVTVAPQIRKEDGLVNWERSAPAIDRQVRAYTPWPGAYTFWEGSRLKVIAAFPLPGAPTGHAAGFVVKMEGFPAVLTGEGLLRLDQVQLEGRSVVSGAEFARGRPDFIGSTLGPL